MISYENTRSRQHHVLSATDAREALAPVLAFLRRCTTCTGALRADGVPIDRHDRLLDLQRRAIRGTVDPSVDALAELQAVVDELVSAGRPCNLDLVFDFQLCDPATREPYVADPEAHGSFVSLHLRNRLTSELAMALHWPFDDATPAFLRAFDAAFGALQLLPRRGVMSRNHVAWDFDRGAHVPPPDDVTGRALHDAVLANPDDEGARTAYADWLGMRGDPLGEALALQLELARGPKPHRATKLRARLRELRRAHGLWWSRVLVPD